MRKQRFPEVLPENAVHNLDAVEKLLLQMSEIAGGVLIPVRADEAAMRANGLHVLKHDRRNLARIIRASVKADILEPVNRTFLTVSAPTTLKVENVAKAMNAAFQIASELATLPRVAPTCAIVNAMQTEETRAAQEMSNAGELAELEDIFDKVLELLQDSASH